MKTVAVIPAYNESNHVISVLERVSKHVDTVIVVDDGSKDDTFEHITSMVNKPNSNIIGLRHIINLGKGAALKTACEAAKKIHADVIITMDADNQHNPEHIPEFINEFKEKQVDMVFGSREFNNNMPLMMLLGNRGLSVVINILFKLFVHDTQSGYRAFTASAYDNLKWDSTGYGVETEMIVHASENELSYSEITVDTIYHDDYKGTTALDGMKIFLQILKWKLF